MRFDSITVKDEIGGGVGGQLDAQSTASEA
jgi:hypothetical protein